MEYGEAILGRSILVTGHTGFKGSWLCLLLHQLGARVTGYALPPPTEPSNFVAARVSNVLSDDVDGDVRDQDKLEKTLRTVKPDVILHLAAQSVVRKSHLDPTDTFSVNVMGTASLLEAIRRVANPCAVVIVSSDKCYENDGSGRPFSENDPMGGSDPYSASKAATELVAAAYRRSFFPPEALSDHGVAVASARAGNVIGGGDWTPDGIVADALQSLVARKPIPVRSPRAIRPWQHVLEPLGGYLTLAARLMGPDGARFCRGWNFGPETQDEATVQELVERIVAAWGEGTWMELPTREAPPEAEVLRLTSEAAVSQLGWRRRWSLNEAIDRTVKWFRHYESDPDEARAACLNDIEAYRRIE